MGDPVVLNILKTNAIVYYAPLGTALPDIDLAAGQDWPDPWDRIGFTKEPLTVAYNATETDISVQEFLAPVDRRKIAHMATFKTVLAETDVDYMQLGMDGEVFEQVADVGQVGYQQIDLTDGFWIVKRVWGFEGYAYDEGDNALPLRTFFTRATSRIGGDIEFSKKTDDYTGWPLEIKALADPDIQGRLLRWQRVTALALP